ncbi:hypothetical protein Agub_g15382, partial [Astrephomene gubernaculifera]
STPPQLTRASLPPASKVPTSPAQRLRDAAAALLQTALTSPSSSSSSPSSSSSSSSAAALLPALLSDLPARWERLGDLALLPAPALTHPGWRAALAPLAAGGSSGGEQQEEVLLPLWRAVAGALGVERLARQAPVANTGTRDSRAVLLLGSHGWVAHREGGVLFRLDVTRCMFSSGNVTERTRMG